MGLRKYIVLAYRSLASILSLYDIFGRKERALEHYMIERLIFIISRFNRNE